jgi:hypothetical protein
VKLFLDTNTGRFPPVALECEKQDTTYYNQCSTLHHRKLARATYHSTNKKQGKGEKQILIGQRVLEGSEWKS